jgi:hypothetical protein
MIFACVRVQIGATSRFQNTYNLTDPRSRCNGCIAAFRVGASTLLLFAHEPNTILLELTPATIVWEYLI